ncbi:MAG TPA: biopolymer transporter ExbD [Bacteroidales bacterium]|nr:biopolymer transporter ExbD [Bacteroidales bacterium]
MAKRELKEINAGSMADIAFLLLIFFLVTTTMDSDTGLIRKLPPIPDPDQELPEDQQINQRNILEVRVNYNNLLLVEGEIIQISELRAIAREFIDNPNEAPEMPEMIDMNIDFFGLVRVPKNAVISLQNDIGTTYGVYIAVQNELLAARDQLKDELSLGTFGLTYDELDEDRQRAVDDYYKVPISEAEPRKIGGN